MIALLKENLKKMKNLKIYNEKTFRDLGSGFGYYIVIGTSVYKKRSRTTKMKKTESKKTETKKAETKKPTAGTKRPFWDGRSRASTPGYRENYNSIFKQKRNFRRSSK